MSKIFGIVLLSLSSSMASAAELKCNLSYFKNSTIAVPFMSAKIDGAAKLSDIKFFYKKYMEERGAVLKNFPGQVKGELITSNHSPYKGNTRYLIKNVGDLVLPSDLSTKALEAAVKTGLGYGRGENGLIITSFDGGGDGAGSHVSYRMICRSSN